MQTLGDRLAIARAAKKWEQKDLADKYGCHATQISMWEKGKRKPKLIAQLRLAEILGISQEWLCYGKEEMIFGSQTGAKEITEAVACESMAPYLSKTEAPLDRALFSQVLAIVLEEGGNRSASELATATLSFYDQARIDKSIKKIRNKVKAFFS